VITTVRSSPSFMRLSLPMSDEAVLRLKPFGTLGAIVFSQTRKIFRSFRILVSCEVFRVSEISDDLINVSVNLLSVGLSISMLCV